MAAALSPRMQAMLGRLGTAHPQPLHIGPGRDFQTCMSLRNRGEVIGVIYGEAPKECVRVELTAQGREKAEKLAAQKDLVTAGAEAPPLEPWPFRFSSRGWHEKTATAGPP